MNQRKSMHAVNRLINAPLRPLLAGMHPRNCLMAATGLMLLMGCASTSLHLPQMVEGQRMTLEGRVSSADLSPMAHDGDALIVVTGTAYGAVTVRVPARRHLCKATGLDTLEGLRPNDLIGVKGVATGPQQVRVCIDPSDVLQRIDH